MDKVGILIVSKCLSGAAIMDAFRTSEKYSPEFYVVQKQANPFLTAGAKAHRVAPDLDLNAIARFARLHRSRISFGLTDTEDFVTAGGRDLLEKEAGVQMICVTKGYAIEGSKADQRLLFERIFPEANPPYAVFDPRDYTAPADARADFRRALSDIPSPVIKPDAPARGAGVGVWGSDFYTAEGAEVFFLGLLSKGRVVIEEKVEGEESSFHAFSDGKHFVPLPLTRDYKRSHENNAGSLTGGMGSYRGPKPYLPFLRTSDWESLVSREDRAFRKWKGRGSEPGLRGVVLYDAIMHTGRGFKVLERNSRGGNTEIINLLTTIEDDFADVCYRMLDGALKGVRFSSRASVTTCAVPSSYGVKGVPSSMERIVDLSRAEKRAQRSGGSLRVFPMDVRLDRGRTRLGTSRTAAIVGVADSIDEAREISSEGCRLLRGPLRWRRDIASPSDIRRARRHLERLRSGPAGR